VSRRAIFWTIVALTGALVLAVVGGIVFSFANAEELLEDAGSELAAYLMIFGLVFADAIVPIFPGETTLNAASVLASQDKLQLELVMLAGALGAVLGDSAPSTGSPAQARGGSRRVSRRHRRRTSVSRRDSLCSDGQARC
jgi:membrane-associated protein